MKTNCWLVLGTMLATTAVAQVNTNGLPEIPAPVIGAAAAPAPSAPASDASKKAAPVKHKKKTVAKPVAPAKIVETPVTLVPGTAVVSADNVNFRGQAGLKGEALGHLKKGDVVTVIAQINLDKPKAGEPSQWAKIALPAGLKVWVNSLFIDTTNKVVATKKLNLRAGPSENYSVLGVLEKGASISEIASKGDWTQIEAPTNAFAFVAAEFLKQEAPASAPVPTPAPAVEPVPATTSTVAEAQPIVTQPMATTPAAVVETPAPPVAMAPVAPVVPPTIPEVAPNFPPVVVETNLPPPPPRVVTHEGYVRSSISIVAPTYFELYDPATSVAINYLYSPTTNLDLARYNGFHIVVTGEEGLDARWKDTPVLNIQKIYVLSTNAPSAKQP